MKQEKGKKAFLYYFEWAEALLAMPDEIRLKIDDALKRYVLYQEEPTDPMVKYSVFMIMRLKIDKDTAMYAEKCEQISKLRSEAGKKHKGNQYVSRLEQMEQMEQTEQTEPDIDIDIDNNKETLSYLRNKETKKVAKAPFRAPTLQEVESYVLEMGLNMDAGQFFDHFTANGWKVGGKTQMKDWKAAVRNWSRRQVEFSKAHTHHAINGTASTKEQRDAEFALYISDKLNNG